MSQIALAQLEKKEFVFFVIVSFLGQTSKAVTSGTENHKTCRYHDTICFRNSFCIVSGTKPWVSHLHLSPKPVDTMTQYVFATHFALCQVLNLGSATYTGA